MDMPEEPNGGVGPGEPGTQMGRGGSRVVMLDWNARTSGAAAGVNWSMTDAIQSATTSWVAHAKANNPAVKLLDQSVAAWQHSLRSEAQQRLGGFKPPLRITNGLLADDWDLLKRVGTTTNATPGGSHHMPFNQPGTSFAMKRSASENSLESMNNAHGGRKHSKQWAWEQQEPSGSSQHQATPSFFTTTNNQAYAEAHASAMQAMVRKPVGLITATEQQHADDDEDSMNGKGQDYFQPGLLHLKRSAANAQSSPGLWNGMERSPRMPRVPTAPSLQELGESLNTSASRNLEAVRVALLNAHASIQETATNCQNNLQTLTTIFQQNLTNSGGPLQAAISNSKAMVTWSISNGNDPLGGALVPWQVFPRVLRARELDAQSSALTVHGSTSTDGSGRGVLDWITPLENYMTQLDANKLKPFGGKQDKSSIRDPGRQVAIVTTASLPWLTGTSVNPLLRAAYLASDNSRKVTLVLPWLSPADQQRVFPHNMQFDTPEQQEEYVRDWARQRTGLDCNFKVTFYPSRYAAEKGSILPVGDITSVIPDHEADVAVLEEPEHLNWYHHGTRWTDKFNHVVGVMHTNYLDYAKREENGGVKEMLLRHINAWVCRIHCHKVVKLSDAVQPLPREDTMFVHGVSPAFLRVGQAKAQAALSATTLDEQAPQPVFKRGVYFLGKVLWAKGYTELLDRLNEHMARTGQAVDVDVYGAGPDLKAVEEEAHRRRLALKFNGARDHADSVLQDYKVFINPSLSDVVATTTAEALAMGKWVVCADHPSNRFFSRFSNCLIYRDSDEFSQCLDKAMHQDPRPLTETELHSLTWEAATERFLDVADHGPSVSPLEVSMDNMLHAVHNALTGVEFIRVAAGAGARTRDMPARITDYMPDENDVGGFFDNSARAKKSWEGKKAGGGGGGGKAAGTPASAAATNGVTPTPGPASVPAGVTAKA